jgi:hypothetical protein
VEGGLARHDGRAAGSASRRGGPGDGRRAGPGRRVAQHADAQAGARTPRRKTRPTSPSCWVPSKPAWSRSRPPTSSGRRRPRPSGKRPGKPPPNRPAARLSRASRPSVTWSTGGGPSTPTPRRPTGRSAPSSRPPSTSVTLGRRGRSPSRNRSRKPGRTIQLSLNRHRLVPTNRLVPFNRHPRQNLTWPRRAGHADPTARWSAPGHASH